MGQRESSGEMREAIRALGSVIGKCEKARSHMAEGTSQHTNLSRQLHAYRTAVELLNIDRNGSAELRRYPEQELQEAAHTMSRLVDRCRMLPQKFDKGTPQHTLAVRRLRAFELALAAIRSEMGAGGR